jgi:hypothetical protein
VRKLLAVFAALLFALNVRADIGSTGTSPSAGGGGSGGASFPLSTVATFGSADGAANSISFNETAGAETFEGSVSDTNELRVSTGALDQDASLTYSAAASIMTITPVPAAVTLAGNISVGSGYHFLVTNGHVSILAGNSLFIGGNQSLPSISKSSTGTGRVTMNAGPYASVQWQGKSLTDGAAAATFLSVPITSNSMTGGEVHYAVTATTSGNFQVRQGWLRFSLTNLSGTETCVMGTPAGVVDASITEVDDTSLPNLSSGTLTYAITCITSATNQVDFQIAADSSLATPTMTITGWMKTNSDQAQTAPSVP